MCQLQRVASIYPLPPLLCLLQITGRASRLNALLLVKKRKRREYKFELLEHLNRPVSKSYNIASRRGRKGGCLCHYGQEMIHPSEPGGSLTAPFAHNQGVPVCIRALFPSHSIPPGAFSPHFHEDILQTHYVLHNITLFKLIV